MLSVSPVYAVMPDKVRPVPLLAQRLFGHYGPRPAGVSVLKLDGAYVSLQTPLDSQVSAATEYYAGGHVYPVSDAVAAALEAAGYTVGTV